MPPRNRGSHFPREPINKGQMPAPDIAIPSRAPAEVSADDTVLPFEVSALDLRGRVVRLGPAVDQILEGHNYPQPVAKLLGEAIVLGALLGTALKFEGRFILQTKTDGPVPMLVVDFTTPEQGARLRAARQGPCRRGDRGGQDRRGIAARPRASRDDHRSGRRHEPLSGAGRARRRHAGRCRARILPALRTDPDARAARGRGGIPRRERRARAIAGAPAACCCSSCRARRSVRAFPISIRAMRRKASRSTWSRRTMPGSKAARSPRRSRTSS